MALFEKDVEDVVINFIRRKSKQFHSDVAISNMLNDELGLIVNVSAICGIRKKNGIASGQATKNKIEIDIAVKVWNQTRSIVAVADALNIKKHSAKSKLRHLHSKGVIEASEIAAKPRHTKRKPTKWEIEKRLHTLTLKSAARVAEMRQRKMDRVAYLCDMRTL